MLLILTGARCGEIAMARWDWLDGNVLRLPDSKTGAKPVFLPPQALAVVESNAVENKAQVEKQVRELIAAQDDIPIDRHMCRNEHRARHLRQVDELHRAVARQPARS